MAKAFQFTLLAAENRRLKDELNDRAYYHVRLAQLEAALGVTDLESGLPAS